MKSSVVFVFVGENFHGRYAETAGDNIKFRIKKVGAKVDFELLDTPFMSKPAAQSALLVLKLNSSWPVFLASITQSLMEDVTVM